MVAGQRGREGVEVHLAAAVVAAEVVEVVQERHRRVVPFELLGLDHVLHHRAEGLRQVGRWNTG